jgi:hypothetical protein
MLIAIILRLVGLVAGLPLPLQAPATEEVATPRAAQVRLAEVLGGADSIDAVDAVDATANAHDVTFAVTHGDEAFDVVAHTDKRGTVIALEIVPAVRPVGEVGPLSWLAAEVVEATAVTRLAVDEDAAVTITTNDGRRYMVIPGRGSGGAPRAATNTAVEARWAAEWNSHRQAH